MDPDGASPSAAPAKQGSVGRIKLAPSAVVQLTATLENGGSELEARDVQRDWLRAEVEKAAAAEEAPAPAGIKLVSVNRSLLRCALDTPAMVTLSADYSGDCKSSRDSLASSSLIAALFLTMIEVATDNLGNDLEGVMTDHAVDVIYTVLAATTMGLFILCVCISIWLYWCLGLCEANNDPEVTRAFFRRVGTRLQLPYFTLVLGIVFFLFTQSWLLLSHTGFWVWLFFFILCQLGNWYVMRVYGITVKALYETGLVPVPTSAKISEA